MPQERVDRETGEKFMVYPVVIAGGLTLWMREPYRLPELLVEWNAPVVWMRRQD